MSELVVKLTDQVSGPAKKVAQALKAAERQSKAVAAAMKAGVTNRFASDMQRVGATGQQIDKVTRAWEKYRRESRLAADSTKWTKEQIAQVRQWERAHVAALRNVNAAKRLSAGGASGPAAVPQASQAKLKAAAGMSAIAAPLRYVGPVAAAYGVARSVKSYAEADRAIKRIGITADATDKEISKVGATAHGIAQEVAMPYAKVVGGLDTLVAQGRTLKDSMDFLPSVARTAAAANAEVEDIAKTADSVSSNFKIAGSEMQRAFDIMAAGGKAGQFELKDMARYLPSLGPAAAAAGFTGDKGLTELVSMLQIMRKGSGTSEEAAGSMSNILQKMMSEETTKRFAKFGVDLPKAMDKARKEGRNLVEVFEELTHQATKGDLSKIPQLINDMEFARGVRALMSYRGEWQRLAGTIQRTAPGSVIQDLGRVADDTQAKLDRLANSWDRRVRQLGGLVSDFIVGPIDDKLREIEAGKNKPANWFNEQAQHSNADKLARQEIQGEPVREYDPETRRRVDARKAKIERDAVDARVAALDAQIAEKQSRLDRLPQYPRLRAKPEGEVNALKAERQGILDALSARDRATIELIEADMRRKGADTRLKSLEGSAEKPRPLSHDNRESFGFDVGAWSDKPAAPMTQTMRTRDKRGRLKTAPLPLPPARPVSLPKAVPLPPMLQTFDEIYAPKIPEVVKPEPVEVKPEVAKPDAPDPVKPSTAEAPAIPQPAPVKPEVDSTAIEAAKDKAAEAKTSIEGLDLTVSPKVDTASLREALSYAQAFVREMGKVGNVTTAAVSRGRSEIAQATANLSRSRQTNNQGRPLA